MTKAKKLLALLMALVLLLSMAACGDEQPPVSGTTAPPANVTTPETPPEDRPEIFLISQIKDFKIAYSTEVSDATIAAAIDLSDRIKQKWDVKIPVTSDFILESNKQQKEWEHEILIGETNRPASAAFGSKLRQNDYGYGFVDGKIVIYGGNDTAIQNAITMFALDIVVNPRAEGVFFQSDWEKIERYTYATEGLTVNGEAIDSFEIIYAAGNTMFEKAMASRLQNYIADRTGVNLSILTDEGSRTEGKNAFLIGTTKFAANAPSVSLEAGEGCVVGSGKDVVVLGNDVEGVVNGSKLLTELLFPANAEATRNVEITTAQKSVDTEGFSAMTFNLWVSNMTGDRVDRVMNTIYKYMPDTLGIQEGSPEWMNKLTENLSGYYGIVGEGREGGSKGEHTAILYAKEKYNLIESGTKWLSNTPDKVSKPADAEYFRIFTYALLEDKESGVRYLHLNTHLDTAGSSVRSAEVKIILQFLQEYNNVAVVMTGDMNSRITSAEMQLLMKHGFDSVTDFEELKDMTVIGQGASVIDWILVTPTCMTLTYYTTDNSYYNGEYASDHFAYYAEFTVKYPAQGEVNNGWDGEINDYPDEWLNVIPDGEGSEFGDLHMNRR
ncbi:MAG: hypothetical protein E7620_01855 [Ruminococcaceae bacterium]|nr:hypothetical protein [Oscillospiraceae bacterium]